MADTVEPCPRGSNQHELNVCAAQAYQRADRALGVAYRALREATVPEWRPQLAAVQRTWLRFRDAECGYVASQYEGGSMQPMQRDFCLAQLTVERTRQLREQLAEVRE